MFFRRALRGVDQRSDRDLLGLRERDEFDKYLSDYSDILDQRTGFLRTFVMVSHCPLDGMRDQFPGYRAYRVPYAWVPQLDQPRETAIAPVDVTTFRVPGAAAGGTDAAVSVEGTLPYQSSSALCVTSDTDEGE